MNRRSPVLVSAPAIEPVSLSDVKLFLRIDGTDDDSLLTSLIVTARRLCEEYTKRAFITQTWKLTLDRFGRRDPDDCLPAGYSVGPTPGLVEGGQTIQLARQPIQSITFIKTTDLSNTQTTVAGTTYTLDQSGGRVLLNSGQSWPCDLRAEAAVEITTVNGYGDDGGDVPEPINQAIIQTVGSIYENRSCWDIPEGAKTLLAPYMLPEAYGLGF